MHLLKIDRWYMAYIQFNIIIMSLWCIRAKILNKIIFDEPSVLTNYTDSDLNEKHIYFLNNRVPRSSKKYQHYKALISKCKSCGSYEWIGFMFYHLGEISATDFFPGYNTNHLNTLCKACQNQCGCSNKQIIHSQKCDNCDIFLCKKHGYDINTYNNINGTQTSKMCKECSLSCGCSHFKNHRKKEQMMRCQLCYEIKCVSHQYNEKTDIICRDCRQVFVKFKNNQNLIT